MSIRLALMLSLILGVAAAVGAYSWLKELEYQKKSEIPTVSVAVARIPLKKGQILERDRYRQQIGAGSVSRDLFTSGMITEDQIRLFLGKQLTRDLNRGDIILNEFLEDPLSTLTTSNSVVRRGYRAFTMQVDLVSGVANLIRPTDYVDIIETYDEIASPDPRNPSATNSGINRITKSRYLLQAIRILAIDTTTMASSRTTNYRSVTLELTPDDCLKLAEASARNRIQLVLRARDELANSSDLGAAPRPN